MIPNPIQRNLGCIKKSTGIPSLTIPLLMRNDFMSITIKYISRIQRKQGRTRASQVCVFPVRNLCFSYYTIYRIIRKKRYLKTKRREVLHEYIESSPRKIDPVPGRGARIFRSSYIKPHRIIYIYIVDLSIIVCDRVLPLTGLTLWCRLLY